MKKKHFVILILASVFLNFSSCEDNPVIIKNEVKGIVRDYTGLDGCGFIIELINGDKLEPVEINDENFVLMDGQRVILTYTELSNMSICMVGKTVRIDSIRELECKDLNPYSAKLPSDPFSLDTLGINGDCLGLALHYSGGCHEHDFSLTILPTMKNTSKGMLPVLALCHNANGDLCEAWIGDHVSFDISSLQNSNAHSTKFILVLNYEGSAYSKEIDYYY